MTPFFLTGLIILKHKHLEICEIFFKLLTNLSVKSNLEFRNLNIITQSLLIKIIKIVKNLQLI